MANIQIDKNEFKRLLGKEISDKKLLEQASYLGAHWHSIENGKAEVEVYPNRPDLLSVEGLARAYKGFFGVQKGLKDYPVEKGDIEVKKEESVEEVRPYIGAAVVRNLNLSKKSIESLIQLQEKLHKTMGRERNKLAIGLHDLSQLKPPFKYKAVKPGEVSFTPLEHEKQMSLEEILEKHEKGVKYSWILEECDKYPIITDADEKVLSFPPIINNKLTEVDNSTENVFIDVTGKDRQTVEKALNIVATAIADRGGTIESVWVDGKELPDLYPEEMSLDIHYFRKISGLSLMEDEIKERLEKMNYDAEKETSDSLKVKIPAYRTNIMHQYDLIEDIVIAHGYGEITPELPEVDQIGDQKGIEEFTSLLRQIMVSSGVLETNTYFLSSKDKLFDKMESERKEIVEMKNSLTEDYSALRNWMTPSMLQVLKNNRHHGYPQKFFEAEDVAVLDDSPTGASNVRKLAYIVSDKEVDFNDVREVLQVLERDLGEDFRVKADEKPFLKSNRSGDIFIDGEKLGFIGEISQQVVENWDLEKPVAVFELNIDKLYELIY